MNTEYMSIKISEETRSLEFTVKGYQFEQYDADDIDRNWLNIGITYRDGEDTRECVDPCLETWDVSRIIEGFEEVLNGTSADFCDEYIRMAEPNIRFKIYRTGEGTFSLIVLFWNEGKLGTDIEKHILVKQEISSNELRALIENMRAGLKKFPIRY